MNNLSSSPFFEPHSSLSHRQPCIRILIIFLEIFANTQKYLYAYYSPSSFLYNVLCMVAHFIYFTHTLLYHVLFLPSFFSLSPHFIYIYIYIYLNTHTHTHTHIPVVIVVQLLSHVQLFATPWTVALQAPLSMGFPRQEYWSGLPLSWIFLTQGSNPHLLHCGQIFYC